MLIAKRSSQTRIPELFRAALILGMLPMPGVSIECFTCIYRIPDYAEEEYNPESWPMCSDYPLQVRTEQCNHDIHFCREVRLVYPSNTGVIRYCGESSDLAADCWVLYNNTVCTCSGDRCNVHLLAAPAPVAAARRRWWLLLTAPAALALLLTAAAGVRLRRQRRLTRQEAPLADADRVESSGREVEGSAPTQTVANGSAKLLDV